VRALARSSLKLADHVARYPETLEVVQRSTTSEANVEVLVDGAGVAIITRGSPNKETLILELSARTLTAVLRKNATSIPRLLWMTSIGINEATQQGHECGISASCCPSCTICCGYGLMGCRIFHCVIPCLNGEDLWDDGLIGRCLSSARECCHSQKDYDCASHKHATCIGTCSLQSRMEKGGRRPIVHYANGRRRSASQLLDFSQGHFGVSSRPCGEYRV